MKCSIRSVAIYITFGVIFAFVTTTIGCGGNNRKNSGASSAKDSGGGTDAATNVDSGSAANGGNSGTTANGTGGSTPGAGTGGNGGSGGTNSGGAGGGSTATTDSGSCGCLDEDGGCHVGYGNQHSRHCGLVGGLCVDCAASGETCNNSGECVSADGGATDSGTTDSGTTDSGSCAGCRGKTSGNCYSGNNSNDSKHCGLGGGTCTDCTANSMTCNSNGICE